MDANKDMNRREFLKRLGLGATAAVAAATGCSTKKDGTGGAGALAAEPEGTMTYRRDAHGEEVSLLGYGCMRLPTVEGKSGREDAGNAIDQDEVNRLVDYAISHGVNLFDTSPAYCQGRSEHAMGIALSRHKRSEYKVSTKLSNFAAETYSREASIAMYHNSLKELRVDYIDYMLLHAIGQTGKDLNGNTLDSMQTLNARYIDNGVLDFLVSERSEGRIRNLGFSYHGDIAVFDLMLRWHDEGRYHWDFALIQLSYVDWKHAKQINARNTNAEYLYGELERRGIKAFVMEPLLGGRLAHLNDRATTLLKEREPEVSIASWAFRFAGSKPGILTVLSGMTYMSDLQDNLRTYSPLRPLDESEYRLLADIADIYANYPTIPCNTCQYCMPCPYGLDIPQIFTHYNRCLDEGNVIEDRRNEAYRQARRAFLVGYDRSVPRLRQADHCTGCRQCVTHCPQQIDIPQEMFRIDDFVESLKRDGAELGTTAILAMAFRRLEEGNYSCVVHNAGVTRTFSQRGVNDLYSLLRGERWMLHGACVADKIIGKGAAALLVLGKVKAVKTRTITTAARQMLQERGIAVYAGQEIDHIVNRTGDDWCPLEKRLRDIPTAEACLPVIDDFMVELLGSVPL